MLKMKVFLIEASLVWYLVIRRPIKNLNSFITLNSCITFVWSSCVQVCFYIELWSDPNKVRQCKNGKVMTQNFNNL